MSFSAQDNLDSAGFPIQYPASNDFPLQYIEGCIAHWSMRSSGTAVFDEVGPWDATAVNSPAFSLASGVRSKGVALTAASSQRIDTDANFTALDNINNFAVSCWVKQNANANETIFSSASVNSSIGLSGGFFCRLRSDKKIRIGATKNEGASLYSEIWDTDDTLLSDFGGWNHIVINYRLASVFDGDVWCNNVATSGITSVLSQNNVFNIACIKSLEFGCVISSFGRDEFLDGAIDEVKIFNRNLTAPEVALLYKYDRRGAKL